MRRAGVYNVCNSWRKARARSSASVHRENCQGDVVTKSPIKPGVVVISLCVSAILASAAVGELQPQGLDYVGIYPLRVVDPNLTGRGVKMAVIARSFTYIDGIPQNDYLPNLGHNCFANAMVEAVGPAHMPAGVSPHSTAVCSILFGRDAYAAVPALGAFQYEGVAPDANAEVYEFWHFLTNNVFGAIPPDADVITASFGDHFQDWWTRGFESMAEHYGIVVVAGIGNGSDAYDSLLYPAAGSNVIGVGVIDTVSSSETAIALANFALAHPEHSSCGPTLRGSCKPDIVAPGNCLAASDIQPDLYEATGSWASFAAPLVAGACGLLVQAAKEDPALASAADPNGGNCTIKAILLNSARKLPYWHKGLLTKEDDHRTPLDYTQGAGMLNALRAYEQLAAGRYEPNDVPANGWDNNMLSTESASTRVYKFSIDEPNGKVITVTAAWNNHYSSRYPFEGIPQEDANLRIELWGVSPQNAVLIDYSDSNSDNVEHIYTRADPNYAYYELVIRYADSADLLRLPPVQRYGLAWSVTDSPDSNDVLWYDLNADGVVDENDSVILVENILANLGSHTRYALGDINSDGTIDPKDVELLAAQMERLAPWLKERK